MSLSHFACKNRLESLILSLISKPLSVLPMLSQAARCLGFIHVT